MTHAAASTAGATTGTVRILIVDDHAIVREGLRTLLSEEPGLEWSARHQTAIRPSPRRGANPDVVLMDLVMPEVDGIEATRRLRQADLPCRVIVLTSFADDRRVRDALQAGAIGYLLKDVLRPELVQAIRASPRGPRRCTRWPNSTSSGTSPLPTARSWWRTSPSASTRCCA